MSVTISEDARRLPNIIAETYREALIDDVAPAIIGRTKGVIRGYDLIDSGTYLETWGVTGQESSGDSFTVVIEPAGAQAYAGAIKRGRAGNYNRLGQKVPQEGIEAAEGDIKAALDKAGRRVQG